MKHLALLGDGWTAPMVLFTTTLALIVQSPCGTRAW